MEPQWLITFDDRMSAGDRRKSWELQHKKGYKKQVWSITQDVAVRGRLVSKVREQREHGRILIPGCGSEVYLQNALAKELAGVQRILCTDHKDVVQIARRKRNHALVEYDARDSTDLAEAGDWDVVVPVNSILSSSDHENRQMVRSCAKALRPGGALVGYFPTIFCAFEISQLAARPVEGAVDVQQCLFYEARQRMHQIFYTPLRLRRVLKEAGLRLDSMEIVFFDGKSFGNYSKRYYGKGLGAGDLVVYELLVVAHKA